MYRVSQKCTDSLDRVNVLCVNIPVFCVGTNVCCFYIRNTSPNNVDCRLCNISCRVNKISSVSKTKNRDGVML